MTDRILELVVEGVDTRDANDSARIADHLSDLAWATVDGLVTVSKIGEFDPVLESRLIAQRIAEHLPAARVTRWFEDFVTTAEIANRVGVTREAVRIWAKAQRGPKTFPIPYANVGLGTHRSAIWIWGQVSEWLDAHGRADEDLNYPSDSQVVHINALLDDEFGQAAASGRIGATIDTLVDAGAEY